MSGRNGQMSDKEFRAFLGKGRTPQEDHRRAQGREAALSGLTKESQPYGRPPFPNGYQISERSDWLLGFDAGSKEMEELALEAMAASASRSPVAVAALEYALVVQRTSILRDPVARATAARGLIDALMATSP